MTSAARCPDCGAERRANGWSEDLCPSCLLELGLDEPWAVEGGPESAASPGPGSEGPELFRGKILVNRYSLRELLGRGGMGEVWHAFDLKLRVDVALKTVRPELTAKPHVAKTLRDEVRAARAVVSPNVCRVHDLVEVRGRDFVSMEYVRGATLRSLLEERGRFELQEAREVAAQLLAGLEAIHAAGLVHRDVKPENVMVTRTGRVVVMDFGIAAAMAAGESAATAGTPHYMAPEQARGEAVDARADVYSAALVLDEMISGGSVVTPGHPERGGSDTARPTQGSLWREVLASAAAARPEQRPADAAALARALEEVTERVEGAEGLRPYPGLVAFDERNRDFFFGRELEIEALWSRVRRQPLLGLVGPSGAGKTSFLRAGMLGRAPPDWGRAICAPGDDPFGGLGRALLPGTSRSPQEPPPRGPAAADALAAAAVRWRHRTRHALLIVDQFEELFTMNPADVQVAFVALLRRLVVEADLHVLLSMRDDFLVRGAAHEALRPILSELTVLAPPTGADLRRALVQPALKCGYRFEDETLLERMLSEVRGERGALPLLAFAAEQLWERREPARGVLTRAAFEAIGGVSGALAQHAEKTLERIGSPRVAVVREIFRNLVTAEGTRAVWGRDELLSLFPAGVERSTAAGVLDALVDARLLTAYREDPAASDGSGRTRVEIVHESLLSSWPRLVHWRAQDVEGAKTRDDLRQAARRWRERGRPADLLWTGGAYRELQVWRDRYSGALTESEEAFVRATFARARRRVRRVRAGVAVAFASLLAVVALVEHSRQQAAAARDRAVLEARRADASQLLARARSEAERDPSAALAWVTKSLELADTSEARRFALAVLQRGPIARVLDVLGEEEDTSTLYAFGLYFRPDGSWLAVLGDSGAQVWPRDGGRPRVFDGYTSNVFSCFSPRGDVLAMIDDRLDLWSFPAGELLGSRPLEGGPWGCSTAGDRLLTWNGTAREVRVQARSFDGEAAGPLLTVPAGTTFDPRGESVAWLEGREVWARALDAKTPPRRLGRHAADTVWPGFGPDGRLLAVRDESGEIRVWSLDPADRQPLRTLAAESPSPVFQIGPGGTWLASKVDDADPRVQLWELEGPPDAEPLELRRRLRATAGFLVHMTFDPSGEWLATSHVEDVSFWPLTHPYPRVLGRGLAIRSLAFTPDGAQLVSAGEDGIVRVWPLSPEAGQRSRRLLTSPGRLFSVAVSPRGDRYLAAGIGGAYVGSLAGGEARELTASSASCVAFDSTGRLAAVGAHRGPPEQKVVRVWDLEAGTVKVLGPVENARGGYAGACSDLSFTPDGRLLVSADGLRLWDLTDATAELLDPAATGPAALTRDGRGVVYLRRTDSVDRFHESPGLEWPSELIALDLASGARRRLASAGARLALDRGAGRFVMGAGDGSVSVGPLAGTGESHLLLGHESVVQAIAVSPDGSRIASAAADRTLRLWPKPAGRPLHTLPRDELLSRLRATTNLHVQRDATAPGGYSMTLGPFPGWEAAPDP